MNVLEMLEALLLEIIKQNSDMPPIIPSVEPTRDIRHGEFCTNVAMIIGNTLKVSPVQIAEMIITPLLKHADIIKTAECAKPGFINITLTPAIWARLINHIVTNHDYGSSNTGNGEKVNIDYASANPTGPIHIGHIRGAVVGDAMASIMIKSGYQVTREYYINDAGNQVNILAKSALLRYREALGQDIGEIPSGMYPGEYLIAVGKFLVEKFGDSLLKKDDEGKAAQEIRQLVIDIMMDNIKEDLSRLNIKHDVFTSEQEILNSGIMAEAISILRAKDLIYEDFLEQPKYEQDQTWEPRKQTIFRSSVASNDNTDRALTRADGSWSYFASDIAYSLDKIKRGHTKLVIVLGRDHIGYVERLQAAVSAISDGKVELKVMLCHLVNLIHEDKIVKMSKRKGNFLTAQDVIEIIGADVISFMMLSRSNDMILDFDLEKAREASKDNPVFYIQYAHARAHSIIRRAIAAIPNIENIQPEIALLSSEAERSIMRALAEWPFQLSMAARKYEPHRVAFYLQNLAKSLHAFWNMGKDAEEFRFVIPENPVLTATRLTLIKAVASVIASGLTIFKVQPVEEL